MTLRSSLRSLAACFLLIGVLATPVWAQSYPTPTFGSVGLFGLNSATTFTLSHSNPTITTYPVPGMMPTTPNTSIALDIWPNGTPAGPSNAWIDICDKNPSPGYCLRVINTTTGGQIDTKNFGVAQPLILQANDTEGLRIDTNARTGIGTGSATLTRDLTIEYTHGQLNRALTVLSGATATSVYSTIGGTTDMGFLGYIGTNGDGLTSSLANDIELATNTGRLLIGTGQTATTKGTIAAVFNSSGLILPTIPTGTATYYVCATAAGQLIMQVAACP